MSEQLLPIVNLENLSVADFASGAFFGSAGAYEVLDGKVRVSVVPDSPQ